MKLSGGYGWLRAVWAVVRQHLRNQDLCDVCRDRPAIWSDGIALQLCGLCCPLAGEELVRFQAASRVLGKSYAVTLDHFDPSIAIDPDRNVRWCLALIEWDGKVWRRRVRVSGALTVRDALALRMHVAVNGRLRVL